MVASREATRITRAASETSISMAIVLEQDSHSGGEISQKWLRTSGLQSFWLELRAQNTKEARKLLSQALRARCRQSQEHEVHDRLGSAAGGR